MKVFDSVPIAGLLKACKSMELNKNLVRFIELTSKMLKTNLILNREKGTLDASEINVKCGIF